MNDETTAYLEQMSQIVQGSVRDLIEERPEYESIYMNNILKPLLESLETTLRNHNALQEYMQTTSLEQIELQDYIPQLIIPRDKFYQSQNNFYQYFVKDAVKKSQDDSIFQRFNGHFPEFAQHLTDAITSGFKLEDQLSYFSRSNHIRGHDSRNFHYHLPIDALKKAYDLMSTMVLPEDVLNRSHPCYFLIA